MINGNNKQKSDDNNQLLAKLQHKLLELYSGTSDDFRQLKCSRCDLLAVGAKECTSCRDLICFSCQTNQGQVYRCRCLADRTKKVSLMTNSVVDKMFS